MDAFSSYTVSHLQHHTAKSKTVFDLLAEPVNELCTLNCPLREPREGMGKYAKRIPMGALEYMGQRGNI